MSHHRVLLLSGGLDSTALLVTGHPDLSVFIDYGQPAAAQERAASSRMADRFDIEWREIVVRGVKLGRMADAPGISGPRFVQARNAFLISLAANICDGPGCVLYGAHLGDAENYPDCREDFVSAMCLALGTYGVAVQAPYINKPRSVVLEDLRECGIEFNTLWSCYYPLANEPCGKCDSCLSR